MSTQRPECADCLASPSPRTRGLAMPILGVLLCGQLTGCFLIPTVAVSDCVCDMGQICTEGNVCQAKPDGDMPDADMKPPCIYNSECDGSVCEYNSANIMANRCLSMDMLVFVDAPGKCSAAGDGTRQNPYCLAKAISAVASAGSNQAIRLLADTDYGPINSKDFAGKSLTIYGPFEPKPEINPLSNQITMSGQSMGVTAAIVINHPNTDLTLDGVVVSANGTLRKNAIECSNSTKLKLRRSIVRDTVDVTDTTGWGIWADNCDDLRIERSQLINNAGAIYLKYINNSSVINSIVANNNTSGSIRQQGPIHIYRASQQYSIFRFNTIVNNIGPSSEAGAFSGEISNPVQYLENSILVNNSLSSAKSQYSPFDKFVLQDVVVGSKSQYLPQQPPSIGVHLVDPVFVNSSLLNFSLVDDTVQGGANSQCCLGQVSPANGVAIDIYGTQRQSKTEIGAVSREKR